MNDDRRIRWRFGSASWLRCVAILNRDFHELAGLQSGGRRLAIDDRDHRH